MKNKLYTKSYFIKRLIDAGYYVTTLDNINYDDNDIRKWSIVVNRKNKSYKDNIIITCYKTSPLHYWFEIQTKSVNNFKIYTKSMNVVIDQLRNFEVN